MADTLPTDLDTPDFREVGQELASRSGVDLSMASRRAQRKWEARGLALIALSRGDMEECRRVMAPFVITTHGGSHERR